MALNTATYVLSAAKPVFNPDLARRCFLNWRSPTAAYPPALQGSLDNYDPAIPSILHMENVMPISSGYASVFFETKISAEHGIAGSFANFPWHCALRMTVLRTAAEDRIYLIAASSTSSSNTNFYHYNPVTALWVLTPHPGILLNVQDVRTVAYVNGRTILAVGDFAVTPFVEIYEYDVGTASLLAVPWIGVSIGSSNVRGVGSCGNYFLMFTDTIIYWGSPLNMINFDDIDGGAGNQTPIDLKGFIRAILPIEGGAIIYTTRGAIAMRLTNNAAAPFIYKEIGGSGAVLTDEWVTAESGGAAHYAWTLSGMQRITLNSSEALYSDMCDYILSKQYVYWDNATNALATSIWPNQDNHDPVTVKCTLVGARFLVLSYHIIMPPPGGTPSIDPADDGSTFNHAIVYDLDLKRWGHLAVQHTDVFSDSYIIDGVPVRHAKDSVHFLHRTGRVVMAVWGRTQQYSLTQTVNPPHRESVLVLGPMEVTEQREMTIQHIKLRSGTRLSPASFSPAVYVNGSSIAPLAGSSTIESNYDTRITTKIATIAIVGGFNLHDAAIEYTIHGHR